VGIRYYQDSEIPRAKINAATTPARDRGMLEYSAGNQTSAVLIQADSVANREMLRPVFRCQISHFGAATRLANVTVLARLSRTSLEANGSERILEENDFRNWIG
jgi:hypothetical protein